MISKCECGRAQQCEVHRVADIGGSPSFCDPFLQDSLKPLTGEMDIILRKLFCGTDEGRKTPATDPSSWRGVIFTSAISVMEKKPYFAEGRRTKTLNILALLGIS